MTSDPLYPMKVGRLTSVFDTRRRANYNLDVCFKELRSGQHTVGCDFIRDRSGDKVMSLKDATQRARELRHKGNIEAYHEIKKNLPCYVWAGSLQNGCRDIESLSGLVVLDFDELKLDIERTLDSLRQHSNVYACYKTLSGEKCVALVRVDPLPSIEDFKYAWYAAYKKFSFIGKADAGFRRPSHTATGAYDKDLFVNEKAVPLQWEFDDEGYRKAFPTEASEDATLKTLPESVREEVAILDWKEDGWATQQLPCVFQTHEHDDIDPQMGVQQLKDGYKLHCFKCGTKRAYRKKPQPTHKSNFVPLHRFVDYVDEDGNNQKYMEPVPRHLVSSAVVNILQSTEYQPYRRGSQVGYIEDGKFQAISRQGMQGILSRVCDIRRFNSGRWISIDNPPQWLAEDILETLRFEFQEIHSVVCHPFFDGKQVIYQSGVYDGVFLQSDFNPPAMDISREDDVRTLNELFQDYNLAEDSDRENAIALLLTPFIRQSVDVSPLFFITSARANLGKSSVAEICCFVSLGHRPEVRTLGYSKAEIRKSVDAALRYAPEIILFDNVAEDRQIDSGDLASVATQPSRSFRTLGKSEEMTYENRATFLYTGSGLSASKELVTRACEIRIEDDGQRAEIKNWKIPHIVQKWLPQHYQLYQDAALRMVERWIEAGMPQSNTRHRAALWAETIGGILEVNGIGKHFLKNDSRMRKRAGSQDMNENSAWRIAGATLGADRSQWTANDVFKIFSYTDSVKGRPPKGENLLGHLWEDGSTSEHSRRIKLGKYFDSIDGKVFECGFRFEKLQKRDRKGKSLYCLQWTKTPEELAQLEADHSLQETHDDPDSDVTF